MNQDTDQQILETLREIRDGQREIIAHLGAQRTLAEQLLQKSRTTIEESVGLQREALSRQTAITSFAIPAIDARIAEIAYLIIKRCLPLQWYKEELSRSVFISHRFSCVLRVPCVLRVYALDFPPHPSRPLRRKFQRFPIPALATSPISKAWASTDTALHSAARCAPRS